MRLILILYCLCFSCFSFCQTKKVKNEYINGKLEVKGKVIKCPGYDEKFPCYNSTCRKIGKWSYYYENGNIERIENYQKINNCSFNEIPDGIWKYFNDHGLLIKQEEYKNGLLWTSDISGYYFNSELAGKIQVRNGILDTIEYIKPDSINLIKNGDFRFYYGPPQLQVNNGQNQIERQIPFWVSPDKNTPDYYNPFRCLKNVPDNLGHEYNEDYNCVGIILYHEPTGDYSEYLTGELSTKLSPNTKYRLNIRMRLSQNSGFYIDKLGVYFSDSVSSVSGMSKNPGKFSHMEFNETLDNRDEWKNLCALYTASGQEKYITLGRFCSLSETTIKNINPLNLSEGDYNTSAYYLIDKIELLEDTIGCSGFIEKSENKLIDRINFNKINLTDSLTLNSNMTFILKNIFFDFDKSALLPASYNELQKLLTFLEIKNVSVIISGHTDNVGTEDYNRTLSLSRARAVAEWLIKKGIDQKRIQVEGYGAELPITVNDSEENRALNRSVEFKIKQ